MKVAIFPGSFDPFTIGHRDVLISSLNIFDKIVVAVGYNSSKQGFLPVETRIEIIKDSIADLIASGSNIEVISYTGLTIDACKRHNAKFIVRGIRTTTDFEMESVIAQANKKMSPDITSVFITASQEYSFISSTVVRDIIMNGGSAEGFMAEGININNYIEG